MLRSLFLRSAIACAGVVAVSVPCAAGDDLHFETYVYADTSGRSAALASSTVWSFFSPVTQPGLRLKVDGFANVNGESNANVFSSAFMAGDLKALGDVMAGYQLNWNNIWVKLYAGAAYQAQTWVVWQAGQTVQQKSLGAAASVESYWQGGGGLWASGNLSWLQFDNTASFYGRLAYNITQEKDGLNWSLGAETAALIKNADIYKQGTRLDLYKEYVREGALLNLRYGTHDFTISAGLSNDFAVSGALSKAEEGAWRPYATISYGKKF